MFIHLGPDPVKCCASLTALKLIGGDGMQHVVRLLENGPGSTVEFHGFRTECTTSDL